MCGDNSAGRAAISSNSGSPPRVWGQPAATGPAGPNPRFTPTCVGTTICCCVSTAVTPVHPHVCGDNRYDIEEIIVPDGSPPRVWGQPDAGRWTPPIGRFTPTCVGTTSDLRQYVSSHTVHPHVCGDNLVQCIGMHSTRWFTPTCVGTTSYQPFKAAVATVHPHVCGDNLMTRSRSSSDIGSPPRVWGQLSQKAFGSAPTRFTPTCVGTTKALDPYQGSKAVHPHVCGDNFLIFAPNWQCGNQRRFTPTCVGTTPSCKSAAGKRPVHPHVCGDNLASRSEQLLRDGSPPRVWGQRFV